MLDDIALFVHIAKTGSLSKAAEIQAIPAATVTRRLQKLERRLKCKLINRSARQFNLTLRIIPMVSPGDNKNCLKTIVSYIVTC